jgi:hypothetical protein
MAGSIDNNHLKAAVEEMVAVMADCNSKDDDDARRTTATMAIVVVASFLLVVAMLMLFAVLGCWLLGAYHTLGIIQICPGLNFCVLKFRWHVRTCRLKNWLSGLNPDLDKIYTRFIFAQIWSKLFRPILGVTH